VFSPLQRWGFTLGKDQQGWAMQIDFMQCTEKLRVSPPLCRTKWYRMLMGLGQVLL
jgi:hypothetical protein